MPATVELLSPQRIKKNPDNPRLIFRQDELDALEGSIKEQGILVPLSVYRQGREFVLLDGERRWRCAIKLGLHSVPAIIQEKPDRATNIMMMFAIHNARQDWDPLPTALKLQELQDELTKATGEVPTEAKLAAFASLRIGEVRRYRKILSLPEDIRQELMRELNRPRHEQTITVDHVLEAQAGARQLAKRDVLSPKEVDPFVRVVIEKFRSKAIKSTVEPRKLARIARAVERAEVSAASVRKELHRFMSKPDVGISEIFSKLIEGADFRHGTQQLLSRGIERMKQMLDRDIAVTDEFAEELRELIKLARRLLEK